jgi:hypothetical protein
MFVLFQITLAPLKVVGGGHDAPELNADSWENHIFFVL